MLIRNNTLTESANSILESATYLYESEMPNVSAYSIPVVANDRFNAGIVSYEDLSRLCEDNGVEIIDGIYAVAEANNIEPADIVVSIDESTVLMDPWVVNEVHQYVVSPVSESHIVSQYTDAMVGAWLETGNEFYLEAVGDPYLFLEADDEEDDSPEAFAQAGGYKGWNSAQKSSKDSYNKWKKDTVTEVDGKKIRPDDPNFAVKIKRFLTDKPREYLAKAAARLRQTYNKFLVKANQEKSEDRIKWYKNIARKILQVVDWVLRKIQKAASINYAKRMESDKESYADRIKSAQEKANEKKTLN